jgi:hypothetical protein
MEHCMLNEQSVNVLVCNKQHFLLHYNKNYHLQIKLRFLSTFPNWRKCSVYFDNAYCKQIIGIILALIRLEFYLQHNRSLLGAK